MKHKSRTCNETLYKLKKESCVPELDFKTLRLFREMFSINVFFFLKWYDSLRFTAKNTNKIQSPFQETDILGEKRTNCFYLAGWAGNG